MTEQTSLVILLLLGGVHGLNPAMGWLFAVSVGLQEQRRGAVWRAFGPLALGHAAAVGAAVAVAAALGIVMPVTGLRWVVGGALAGMGVFQLVRHAHPRLGGMRVGARELTLWSFLMASAHGAGLMAVPFILAPGAAEAIAAGGHAAHGVGSAIAQPSAWPLVWGTSLHAAGYLLVAALVATLIYEVVGLRVLRKAWVNINLVWAIALILTGVLTPML